MFSGSIPALLTPFKDDGIDEAAFQAFVDWQIRHGSSAVSPVGTTGESPTLSHNEHKRVVDLCVEAAAGRVPVIAGAGSNATAEAVALAQHAEASGADAVLVVVPYYNKPTQSGLYAHFKAVHDACGLPIILYNIPGRSVVDLAVETMGSLAQLPRIAGVKDATNDLSRPPAQRALCGADFCQLSGEDATAPAFLGQGGHGCISVTANCAPQACANLQAAWQAGDLARFAELRDALAPLHKALFLEPNPAPVKYACAQLGLCQDTVRLPLERVSDSTARAVQHAMKSAGVTG